jgi:hypothetical protein
MKKLTLSVRFSIVGGVNDGVEDVVDLPPDWRDHTIHRRNADGRDYMLMHNKKTAPTPSGYSWMVDQSVWKLYEEKKK